MTSEEARDRHYWAKLKGFVALYVWIPKDHNDALRRTAETSETTKSDLVRRYLEEGLTRDGVNVEPVSAKSKGWDRRPESG